MRGTNALNRIFGAFGAARAISPTVDPAFDGFGAGIAV